MGFNIAGLVINSNYDKDIEKLSADLKWGIEIIEEIPFETASENWTPDDEFRLFFGEEGTMIFFAHEWVADRYKSYTADTLNYAYSATAMAFQVDFFEQGNLVRSIMEYEGERKTEEGDPLELEYEDPSADGLTFTLIDELLGEKFGNIDLDAKAFRCKKVKYSAPSNSASKEQKMPETLEEEQVKTETNTQSESPQSNDQSKTWWQFWK